MDAAGERRRGRAPRRRVRPARERRVGARGAVPRRHLRPDGQGNGARRTGATRGRSTTCRRAPASSTGWCPGTRSPSTGAGHGDRSHRDGRRPRGLRARQVARACPSSARSTRPGTSTTTTAGCTASRPSRPADQIVGDLAERGFLVDAGTLRPRLRPLLALRHADHLPPLRRLVHRGRRHPAAAARREREGRVGARVHGQAHGRLAAEHGRLEHLAPPLLRPAAAVLSLLVRAPERDRVEGRARRACDRGPRPAPGASPAVDRPRADPLRGLRRARSRA